MEMNVKLSAKAITDEMMALTALRNVTMENNGRNGTPLLTRDHLPGLRVIMRMVFAETVIGLGSLVEGCDIDEEDPQPSLPYSDESPMQLGLALRNHGLAAAVPKMAFGNGLGVAMGENVTLEELFRPALGDILAEVSPAVLSNLDETGLEYQIVGDITREPVFTCGPVKLTMEEALEAWTSRLEKVYPTRSSQDKSPVEEICSGPSQVYVCRHKVARPRVFIPVFPGTNCEYDSARAFAQAGALVETKVFRNLSPQDIRESVGEFEKAIRQAQIIMFPGGFSAGDEPDGSAKFFATAFRNAHLEEAVRDLLENRDGLALGICNGFQALIKLGLVPWGRIVGQTMESPTLTYNTIGRLISKMAYTKVISQKSPWLQKASLGGVYCIPASHGEGRFVAPKEVLEQLFQNGQVVTQYSDQEGRVTMDEEYNINGSYRAVEGITSPDGRCLGKMAHCERRGRAVSKNIYGEKDMGIFASGVEYFM